MRFGYKVIIIILYYIILYYIILYYIILYYIILLYYIIILLIITFSQIWSLATKDGAGVWFEPYCGKSTRVADVGLGQGPNVVLDLTRKAGLVPGSQVFVDNLFTSFPLLAQMSTMGIGCTGTVRQNRLHKVPLPSKKDLEKKTLERGTHCAVYKHDQICVSKNACVCVCVFYLF